MPGHPQQFQREDIRVPPGAVVLLQAQAREAMSPAAAELRHATHVFGLKIPLSGCCTILELPNHEAEQFNR